MGEGVGDIEVALLGVAIDPGGALVMVLGESGGGRALPIWIGSSEAHAIGLLAGGFRPPRPLPHQLLVNVTAALEQHVVEVSIAGGLREGVFVAEILLSNGSRIDARPSDAVPVALAAAVPIRVPTEVLDAAAVPVEHVSGGGFADPAPGSVAGGSAEIESQARQLRRWLEGATAEYFGSDPPRGSAARRALTPPRAAASTVDLSRPSIELELVPPGPGAKRSIAAPMNHGGFDADH